MESHRLIFVLGMHRSGTSVVTRGLQVMGVALGNCLIPPINEVNDKGFWEDADLNALDVEMLKAVNSDWHHLAPIEPIDIEVLRKKGYFLRAAELLRQKIGNTPIFGFKDPRVAKLLPFWKEVFSHCQLNVNYVLAMRHPLSVAKSLAKRDGITAEQSYLLWMGHVLTSLMGSAGNNRVLVDYDRLMQSPDSELRRIAKCFDLEIDPAELQSYKTDFLDQGLRHTVYDLNDLLLDHACPPIVREIYTELLEAASGSNGIDDQALKEKVELWSDEFERLKSLLTLADRLSTQKAVAQEAVAELNQSVTERDGQISCLNQSVAELNQSVTERDGQISSLNQSVTERDGQIASLKQEVESIYRSFSWRISKPLRILSGQLNRWFPRLFALLRSGWTLFQGNNVAAGQSLARWWHHQKTCYQTLKTGHPIRAELRYGYLIRLADGTIKQFFKTKFGLNVSPPEAFPSIASLPSYESEYQADEDFSGLHTDIKALAFYLPQFHAVKENDEWWGKGFTEWTNTRQAEPRFPGHYQPREPHDDIGYYDLSDIEVMRQQASLARKHGIYGFCFYYYWFSGNRLLEKPVDLLLRHPEIDINFCLCWANENWTRTWDGLHKDVLMDQKHLADDAVNFIRDLQIYLEDSRYIRANGKPVIMIYKPDIIPNVEDVVKTWRQWWRDNTGGELEIWCNRTNFADTACKAFSGFIDAVVEFPPHVVPYEVDQTKMAFDTTGHFYDYRSLISDITHGTERTETPTTSFYRSVMLGWDNSARRKDGWSVWYGFSLESYYHWLRHVISYTRRSFPLDRRYVFINAWNEWAEGTYLEPDRKYGYASINTTSRALFDLPFRMAPRVLAALPTAQDVAPGTIGVHVHLYFEDLAEELLKYTNRIPYPFDLFVTTDTAEKAARLQQLFEKHGCQKQLQVIQAPNIGRDIGPFLVSIGNKLASYDFVGHFHGKKSTTVNWGDRWRRYLLDNLLGSRDGIRAIFQEFAQDPHLGLLYPPAYPLIAPHADWGNNEMRCQNLLRELGIDIHLPSKPNFPAGSMFWARGAAIKPMLEHGWTYGQFEPEEGQLMLTLPHAVERLWRYIAAGAGYHTQEILLRLASPPETVPEKRRLALFVHYEPQQFISDADLFYLQELKKIASDIIVISNNNLSFDQCQKLRRHVKDIIQRDNVGFDFAAWRDGIKKTGWSHLASYDEVILANNSCYGPMFPFTEMFSAMEDKPCDFWGVTSFPALNHSTRAEAKLLPKNAIPVHLQSYFMVFKKCVVDSNEFRQFWEHVEDKTSILEAVALYETQLSGKLMAAGFQWDCYLPESSIIQERNNSNSAFNAAYNQPVEMLLLRAPLIKKKVAVYAKDQIPLLKNMIANFGWFPSEFMFTNKQPSHHEAPPSSHVRRVANCLDG